MIHPVIGLSGTLGSDQDQGILKELYNISMIRIPANKPKNFYEESPIVVNNDQEWYKRLFEECIDKINNNRSVLIIADTINEVNDIKRDFVRRLDERLIYTYEREDDPFPFGKGEDLLDSKKIIIATNLAGRGTDIQLTEGLILNGGLHVIVSFMPKNIRIEEQAFGRAARSGEPGSARLIIKGDKDAVFQKQCRDVGEVSRLKLIKKHYDENTNVEENCFGIFTEKFVKVVKQSSDNEEDNLEQSILLDNWALWLDHHSTKKTLKNPSYCKEIKDEIEKLVVEKEIKNPFYKLKLMLVQIKSGSNANLEELKQKLYENLEIDESYTAAIKY